MATKSGGLFGGKKTRQEQLDEQEKAASLVPEAAEVEETEEVVETVAPVRRRRPRNDWPY